MEPFRELLFILNFWTFTNRNKNKWIKYIKNKTFEKRLLVLGPSLGLLKKRVHDLGLFIVLDPDEGFY